MLDPNDYAMPRRREITVTWTREHERAWQQITASRKALMEDHNKVTKLLVVAWIAFVAVIGVSLWKWYHNDMSTTALLVLLVVYHFFERYDAKRLIRIWETLHRTKDVHTILRVRRWLTHDALESINNMERTDLSKPSSYEAFPTLFTQPDDDLNEIGILDFEVHTPGRAL